MSNPFIGEIRIFAFNFAPKDWAQCNGQLLQISQNTKLFAILGTTYGGDGKRIFALPDLRDRVPIGEGPGPGLSWRTLGESGGIDQVILAPSQIPNHDHTGNFSHYMSNDIANSISPVNSYLSTASEYIYEKTKNEGMVPTAPQGGSPHNNMQPYLTLNFCITLQGFFPTRP